MGLIRNTSGAPQGVRCKAGLVWLEPGESRDIEMDADQRERALATGLVEAVTPEKPERQKKKG